MMLTYKADIQRMKLLVILNMANLYLFIVHKTIKFGLSPIPDGDFYTVEYEYFKTHTELSAATDTLDLPDIYVDVVE